MRHHTVSSVHTPASVYSVLRPSRPMTPMDNAARQRALALLHAQRNADVRLCRDIEALCHAASRSAEEYLGLIRKSAWNLRANPSVGVAVVHTSDGTLALGTETGRLTSERKLRDVRYQQMLQEKYESINDPTLQAIVQCRKCGGSEIQWDEKQTRSADEGCTLFCVCLKCKHRWTVR
jgi:DNA-directed RNA polymerase subunit M/transcription elongation factor TFIIS